MGCRQFLGVLDEQMLAVTAALNSATVSTSRKSSIPALAGAATAKQHAATNIDQSNCTFRIRASRSDTTLRRPRSSEAHFQYTAAIALASERQLRAAGSNQRRGKKH